MASKKAKTPQEQALIKKRVEFVQSKPNIPKAQARQQFFVQTRAAELQAKGVEVTKEKRAQLRQKFQSGQVQRSGFYTDADRASFTTSKPSSGSSTTTPGTTGTPKQFGTRNVSPAMRQKVSGFKSGNVQASTKSKYTGFDKTLNDFTTQKFMPTVEKYFHNPAVAAIDRVQAAFNPKAKQNYNTWAEKKAAQGGIDLGGALNIAVTVGQIGAGIARLRRGDTSGITRLTTKLPGVTKAPATRPTGPVTSGAKPSNVTKTPPAKPMKFKAPKDEGDFIPGGLDRPIKYNNAPGTKKPTRKKPYGVETPGGPVISPKTGKPLASKKPAASKPAAAKKPAAKKTQAQMQADVDNAVSGGLAKALKPKAAPASNAPDMNASNLTFIPAKPTAAASPKATTRKPAGPRPAPKTTRAKAQAGKNFNQKVKQVNSGPKTKIDPKIKKYESQEAFDKFMNSGGKEVVVQATRANPEVGRAFTEANKEFIKTRSTRSTSQAAARKKRADRRTQAALRLNRIRANQAARAAGN
jgi:hypothetical protein